jgi:hypothetical protein
MQNTTWKHCVELSSCSYGVPLFCLLPHVSPVKWWTHLFGLSVDCLHLNTPSDASGGPRQIFHLGYGHGHPCSSDPSAYPVWAPLVVLVGVELWIVLEGHPFCQNLPHIPIHISFVSQLVVAMLLPLSCDEDSAMKQSLTAHNAV